MIHLITIIVSYFIMGFGTASYLTHLTKRGRYVSGYEVDSMSGFIISTILWPIAMAGIIAFLLNAWMKKL